MTPIERAARALCEARGIEPYDSSWWHVSEQTETNIFIAEHDVRAVLAAIREPSEVMVKAGCLTIYTRIEEEDVDDLKSQWTAMIDAMLEEG